MATISAVERRHREVLAKLGQLATQVAELPEQIAVVVESEPVRRFYFNPEQRAVKVGQEFLVEVRVDTLGAMADGAQAVVTFDPAYLSVVKVVPGIMFELVIYNQLDTEAGKFSFAAGVPFEQKEGLMDDGTLVTLRCKALAATPGTTLAFVGPPAALRTKLAYQGVEVPAETMSTLVVVIG